MTYRKLRLIPDHMYERLHQSNPRSVDFGDDDNALILNLTADIHPVLKDRSKPIEERVRIMHQHMIRKQMNREQLPVVDLEKKDADQRDAEQDMMNNDAVQKAIIAQRNETVLGKEVRISDDSSVFHPVFATGR